MQWRFYCYILCIEYQFVLDKMHYLSNNFCFEIECGINKDCFSILPSINWIKYRQNTWASETAVLIFSFFVFFVQINFVKINRELSYTINLETLEVINNVLLNNGYYIKDDKKLTELLSETDNRELVILCKNIPNHPYLPKIILGTLIHYPDCIESKSG